MMLIKLTKGRGKMVFKSNIGATCTRLTVVSFNAFAATALVNDGVV